MERPTNNVESGPMKEKLIALLKEDGLTLAIVAILIVAYAILRTPGDKFASAAELEAQITSGERQQLQHLPDVQTQG